MQYTYPYLSPLGKIILASNGTCLTGLWFEGQKYFARTLGAEHEERDFPSDNAMNYGNEDKEVEIDEEVGMEF